MSSNHFFEGFELPRSGDEANGLIIPRSFFERVVITEPASTIRVVAFILLRTLSGQNEVEASYTDLVRELRLCRQSVQEGLARTIEAGYIRLLQSGENGHIKSRYAICWATSSSSPPPSSPSPGGEGSSTNHHGSHSSSTTSTPTSTPLTISTLPVRKNQNATGNISNHSPTNQTTEEKQTGSISRIIPSPVALAGDSNSNKSSKTNKVSMINRMVESQVESGLPARKVDRQQQQGFYSSTFPANTTSVATTATLPSSTIDLPVASSYYCSDSLALNPGSVYPATTTKPTLAISSYLSHLSYDFSREFADISHKSSNRTQTHNLWHQTHLTEAEFARLMYQARELTRRHAVLRSGEVPPPPGQPRNRMPYFFTCLRDLLGLRGEEGSNKSSPKLRKTSSNNRANDETLNLGLSANQRYLSAAPSHQEEACWQHEAEHEPQGDAQLENAAYSTQSKLSYKSGSHWREAQAFSADAEPDNNTRRRSGFALADSPLPASSGSIPPPVLLNFPDRRELASSSAGTTMVAHSPISNRANSYWNGQTVEGDDDAEDEPNEFTTDHTQLEIVSNFKQRNASNLVGDTAVPDRPLFGGAEARSRERYLAKYGPRGFPACERIYQTEETTSNLTT